MNERIQELAHEADFIGKKHNGAEWRWGYIDPELEEKLERFAELLIRECIDLAVKEEERYDSLSSVHAAYCSMSMTNFQQVLKQHFGVDTQKI